MSASWHSRRWTDREIDANWASGERKRRFARRKRLRVRDIKIGAKQKRTIVAIDIETHRAEPGRTSP